MKHEKKTFGAKLGVVIIASLIAVVILAAVSSKGFTPGVESATKFNLFSVPSLVAQEPATHDPSPKEHQRQAYQQRFFDLGVLGPVPGVVIATSGNGEAFLLQQVSTSLVGFYQRAGQVASSSAFTPAFYSQGLFEEVFSGQIAQLKRMDALGKVERFVLAKLDLAPGRSSGIEGFVTVDGTLKVVVLDTNGKVISRKTHNVPGAGADEQAARLATTKRLVELAVE